MSDTSMVRELFPILRKRLDEAGCRMGTEDFLETVCELFVQHFRCSDEDLLHNPDDAKKLCERVRSKVRNERLSDYTILRTLTNARKSERSVFGESD